MIIEGKGEVCQKSCLVMLPKRPEIGEILNGVVINNMVVIIKMKTGIKGIGIDDKTNTNDSD